MKIIPAILPNRYYDIPNAVEKVIGATNTVQIDFVDGFFAPNRTWWFNNKDSERLSAIMSEEEGLPFWDEMNYELDLMVRDPLEHIESFVALGPSKLIFHVEGLDQEKMLQYFEQVPEIMRITMSFGMAIGIDTDPALIAPYIDHINSIQCMGIAHVGSQGQPFDERVYDQIRKVKEMYPDKIISVDGGVSEENAPLLVTAGATQLVVGSKLFLNEDIHGTIRRLKNICKEVSPSEN
jgi:ribulose-phosphate 3-epimerase